MSVAEARFNRGIKAEIWTDQELAPVRALLANPLWIWMVWGSLVATGAVFVFSSKGSSSTGHFWLFLLMAQTARRLLTRMTPKAKPRVGLRDWENFKPLRSKYWGESAHGHEELLPSWPD